jgi:hypothetical protein
MSECWNSLGNLNSLSTTNYSIPQINISGAHNLVSSDYSFTANYYKSMTFEIPSSEGSDSQKFSDEYFFSRVSSEEYKISSEAIQEPGYCYYACKRENQSELKFRALGIGFFAIMSMCVALILHP